MHEICWSSFNIQYQTTVFTVDHGDIIIARCVIDTAGHRKTHHKL